MGVMALAAAPMLVNIGTKSPPRGGPLTPKLVAYSLDGEGTAVLFEQQLLAKCAVTNGRVCNEWIIGNDSLMLHRHILGQL